MPFKVFFVVQHFCQDRQSFCFTFIYMLDYSEHYGTPWGPVIDGGGARVVGGWRWGRGAGAWARVGGQMPRGRPEQVSAPHTSHPMGDAGPRWSNKVQQGGETKKKKKAFFCREYYANLTRGRARGDSTGKRMILETQTKKKQKTLQQ